VFGCSWKILINKTFLRGRGKIMRQRKRKDNQRCCIKLIRKCLNIGGLSTCLNSPENECSQGICDFLTTLAAANSGFGKTIRCLLKDKAGRYKSKRGIIVKKKSNKCRSKRE
jgi:hypothetical protein